MRLLFLVLITFLILLDRDANAQKPAFETISEFNIIRNYIFLQKGEIIDYKVPQELTLVDEVIKIRFDYSSNGLGWSNIHVVGPDNINYSLNNEVQQVNTVTILCSPRGASTERKSWDHMHSLVSLIKQEMLSPVYTSHLLEVLTDRGDGIIRELDLKYSLHSDGQSRIVDIVPAESENVFTPYRISEVTNKGQVKIKWQYIGKRERESPDNLSFCHYSNLLVYANQLRNEGKN